MKNSSKNSNQVPMLMMGAGAVLIIGVAAVLLTPGLNQQAFNFVKPEQTKALPDDKPISQNEFNKINVVQAAIVDGFPVEITPHPGSKLVNSKEIVYDGKTSYGLEYDSKGTVKDVLDFFIKQGQEKGWVLENQPNYASASDMEEQISFTTEKYKINIVAELENAPDDSEYVIDVIPQ